MTARHWSKTQNSIISFGYVDSYAKVFLILYPPLENSTTRIAIVSMAQYCRSMVLLSCALDHLGMEQPWVIRLEPCHSLKLKMDSRWTNTWDHGLQQFFGFVAFLLQLVALYQGPVHLPFSKWFKIFSKYFRVLLLKYGRRKHFKTQNHTGWYLWDWTIISIFKP